MKTAAIEITYLDNRVERVDAETWAFNDGLLQIKDVNGWRYIPWTALRGWRELPKEPWS